MKNATFALMLAGLLAGCSLTRPPPACRGELQPINVPALESSNGPG